ncbi:MAG TPA: class C sortase [Pseudogracilibacillus sp.]|nr:class C sortase [Pseudogracilibacillus sp.]
MNRFIIGKYVVPIMFFIGILIFFYPIIGNWLSTKDHYTVITRHNEALAKMSEEKKKEERNKAIEYNDSLIGAELPISDPFAEMTDDPTMIANQSKAYYNVLDIGETMGSIEIPSIDVKLPIYHGVGEEVLSQGIGHMSNSSFPVGGLGTHTALTGHRGLPSSKLFRDLDKVEKDELFYIHTLDETLAYKIEDIQVVLPSETNWLEMKEDKDYVTLITCEPYMINTHRLLVRGERVPYDPNVQKAMKAKPKDLAQIIEFWLFIAGITILIILSILFLYRQWKQRQAEKGWDL